MQKQTIKTHLRPYSISQKRRTTINHAFASGLAPCVDVDDELLDSAIRALGQDPASELACVYCGGAATTWDHLVGLVKGSELRGYGHQLGNLVPSCQPCNSRKGSRDWRAFLEASISDPVLRQSTMVALSKYLERFARPVDLGRVQREAPELWAEYCRIKADIMELMGRADAIAVELREYTVNREV